MMNSEENMKVKSNKNIIMENKKIEIDDEENTSIKEFLELLDWLDKNKVKT